MKHDPDLTDTEAETGASPLLMPGLSVEVFVEYAATHHAVRRAQRNRAFTRMNWKFRQRGIRGAIELYQKQPSPDLLIIESDEDRTRLLPLLDSLARECRENTRVLLIGAGDENEIELYRTLLKLGISDYLPAPVEAHQIITAITDAYRDRADIKLGRITAFIGAGGGTGSSTIAQNVAVGMSRMMGTDVLLADLDPQFGTVGLNFDIEDSYTLTDVLRRGSPIDELLVDRIAKSVDDHLKLLTIQASVDNRAELPVNAIKAILDIANDMPRHVVLDMTHVWTMRTKKTLCRADQIILTTMPTLAGLRNARNVLEVLRRTRPTDGEPILVLNKIGLPRRVEIKADEFRAVLNLPTVFEIPYNARLFSRAQAQSRAAVEEDETSHVSRQIMALARLVNGSLDRGDPRSAFERLAAKLRKWW